MFLKYTKRAVPDKKTGTDTHYIRMRVRYSGQVLSFFIGYPVDPDKWVADAQRCKVNTTHGKDRIPASEINKAIQDAEEAIDRSFAVFAEKGVIPSPKELRSEYGKQIGVILNVTNNTPQSSAKTILDYLDEFVKSESLINTWSDAVVKKFSTLRGHLTEYKVGATLDEVDDSWMAGFMASLTQKRHKNTTVWKYLGLLRWFLRWAAKYEYYTGNSHNTFKPRLKGASENTKSLVYLEWNELLHLYELPLERRFAQVRDAFCFMCFTGIRYSDLAKLKRTDVSREHITIVTKKTDEPIRIELNDYSRAILERYKEKMFPNDLALPVLSNQKMNDSLKVICEKAGFDSPIRMVHFIGSERIEEVRPKHEMISTHTGRHTFVVSALTLGIPAEVIMRFTGHSSYQAMKPYVRIVDDLKRKEMNKFNRSYIRD